MPMPQYEMSMVAWFLASALSPSQSEGAFMSMEGSPRPARLIAPDRTRGNKIPLRGLVSCRSSLLTYSTEQLSYFDVFPLPKVPWSLTSHHVHLTHHRLFIRHHHGWGPLFMDRDIRSKNRCHCYRSCSMLIIKSHIKTGWSIYLLSSFPPTFCSVLTPFLAFFPLTRRFESLRSMLSFLSHTFFVCHGGDI